jgi:cysteine synthase A
VTIADNVLEAIGNTPLVRLRQVTHDADTEILVKLEYTNPSGSIKDRIAKYMIEAAERDGRLQPGYTIVEASTGNTGAALSFVAAVKGYRMLVFTPSVTSSSERTRIMECYGAEINVIDLEQEESLPDLSVHGGVIEIVPRQKCRDLEAASSDVWWARQFSNPENVRAHRETTAVEILEQTQGRVDVFLTSVGTGGTLMGVAQALKDHNPDVHIVGVEPASSPLLGVNREEIPIVEGITDGLILDILDSGLVDQVITVTDEQAISMAHQLAQREGLFCGISSGANVFAALQVAEQRGPDQRIVTVLPDNRDRYLFHEKYTT